jgi:predicted acylesterase/phospholipase RssA
MPKTASEPQLPQYSEADFGKPTKSCDLVMQGGVTSGLVYPFAILQLACEYSFKSIGGTSAGAVAAALAAAAEYARLGGDAAGFVRFQERCLRLPDILEQLFQPSRPFKPVMDAIKAWSSTKSWTRWPGALVPLWRSWLGGAVAGFAAMLLLGLLLGASVCAAIPGAVLGLLTGAVAGLALRLWVIVAYELPKRQFGFCSGMADEQGADVLTDWIHRSLQYIAFGREDAPDPLTFGHLARAGVQAPGSWNGERAINLKMVTTNLSMRRPYALPDLGRNFLFDPAQWKRLFPSDVVRYLEGASLHTAEAVAPEEPECGGLRRAPAPDDWPVVIAVRMSLSFPILLEAVPMVACGPAPAARSTDLSGTAAPTVALKTVLFSDGGLSSNFPVHFFDSFLPLRPTFAIKLEELKPGEDRSRRVSMPQLAPAKSLSGIFEVDGLLGFAEAILDSAKDWQDQMLSEMPGQRERIVHVKLEKKEGGLNLGMAAQSSRWLMKYGGDAGSEIRSAFNFNEHQWRRSLVAYQHLERTVGEAGRVWPKFEPELATYAPDALTYKGVDAGDRRKIIERLDRFAGLAPQFIPIADPDRKFARPAGKLRIVPDV